MTNPHERYARTVKASKLALAIQRLTATMETGEAAHELATRMTPAQRRAAEFAAGVKFSSDATWAEVIQLLTPAPKLSEAEAASLFEGL